MRCATCSAAIKPTAFHYEGSTEAGHTNVFVCSIACADIESQGRAHDPFKARVLRWKRTRSRVPFNRRRRGAA
jgi:hypothetical protein